MLVNLLLFGFSIGVVLGFVAVIVVVVIVVVLFEATSVVLFVQKVQHRAKTTIKIIFIIK